MDLTLEFIKIAQECGISEESPKFAPSPFFLKCQEINKQIDANAAYLARVFEDFVGYYHVLGGAESVLTDAERSKLVQEVALFIAGGLSDVQELRRIARHEASNSSSRQHYESILGQLTKRLEMFSRNNKIMQRERERHYRNPLRLLTATSSQSSVHDGQSPSKKLILASTRPLLTSAKERLQQSRAVQSAVSKPLDARFAERYEGEVARPALLRRYDDFAARQKASLLHEAAHQTELLNEELSLVTSAEASVQSISSMLTEFMAVLSDQSEQLSDVSSYGKTATDAVQQTGHELQLTIDRTESHSRNMALLSVSLALLLLLLDWITP